MFIECEYLDISFEISAIGIDTEFLSFYGWIPVIILDGWNELKAELMRPTSRRQAENRRYFT